ncbi:type II secretion protein F [Methanohalophilus sp. RSK]|uniref:type II secretion system F family protein n=1 Tax=Methanohalophilus sp. RSK TaxID=2485783 RepID=UPI000F43B037|nr:type II secretion system F family protein [Methanohalophilus sp. RSK]RNI11889.1 type II secretion protein F [Methanohalophilus sp. RSK]
MMPFQDIAYRLFGKHAFQKKDKYPKLYHSLKSARFAIPADQYISTGYFYSLLAFFVTGIIFYFIASRLFRILDISIIDDMRIIALLASFIVALLSSTTLFKIQMKLPLLWASTRKAYLDQSLTHAVAYLYALSKGGGMSLFDIFKSLSQQRHIYGVAADEFGYIVRDMEYFGYDMLTALKNANENSPSEKYKNFLDGMLSIISSGGDVTLYLKNKSEQYRFLASREQKTFLETLAILAEVYITVFVVGPVFLITILIVLGFMGSNSLDILYTLVYVLIPIGTVLFIVFLSTISDNLEGRSIQTSQQILNEFDDIRVNEYSTIDEKMLKKISWNYRINNIIDKVTNPFRWLTSKPHYSLILSIPAGLICILYGIRENLTILSSLDFSSITLSYINVEAAAAIDDYIVFAFFIISIPFIVFYEAKRRWVSKVESEMPEFLKKLASINEAGIRLSSAISLVSRSKIGVLNTEIKRMASHLSWGGNLEEVLKKFEYRVRTEFNSRIITFIIRASESTSDVISVLNIAASEAEMQNQLKKERSAEMTVYVFIVYVAFLVFLFIVYVLAAYFLPAVPSSAGDAAAGMPLNIQFDMEAYILLFFHASLIQGVCSGLVAGKMGSGSVLAGVKHSLFLVLIAYITFTQFI